MGLDICIYRVSKPAPFENRIYDIEDLQAKGYCVILPGSENSELFWELLPYTQRVKAKVAYLDMKAVRETYGLSEESYPCAWHANGGIGILDPTAEDRIIDLTQEEIKNQFTDVREEDVLVYSKEEVAYWRKDYDVQDFFHDALGHVENTGYYRLDESVICDFNFEAAISRWQSLPIEAPTEDSALFYWEWY